MQAPLNGSQAYQQGQVNTDYTLQIGIDNVQDAKDASSFFQRSAPAPTNYTFSVRRASAAMLTSQWYEDLFGTSPSLRSALTAQPAMPRRRQSSTSLLRPGATSRSTSLAATLRVCALALAISADSQLLQRRRSH